MTDAYGKTKILILDDERLIRLTLSAKLMGIGYTAVTAASVDEAVSILREDHKQFRAIISDIMMGDMDGFVFRDIVRGLDKSMPIFFMTALDPEEGGGFLKKILEDSCSYYLPKSIRPEVLLKRVQNIVASRKIEQFIERQLDEQRKSLELAANVQNSMLPNRVLMTPRGFYTTLWRPKDSVSGDLYEAVQYGKGVYLYVLGDIQGHGTSAALTMTAVQAFLKQFTLHEGEQTLGPADIANLLHKFFRKHLADVSYMTALICIHRPLLNEVVWLSCGVPDLIVVDPMNPDMPPINPQKRGGLPIGLLQDTVYSADDVVRTPLTKTAVCMACSDGIDDLARDADSEDVIPAELVQSTFAELATEARLNGSIVAVPQKFIAACEEYGYTTYSDDVTMLVFGTRYFPPGIFEYTVSMKAADIDRAAVSLGNWCLEQGWSDDLINRLQLVVEEMLMNIHDHGVDNHERLTAVASMRVRSVGKNVELTIWDTGTPTPTKELVAGDSSAEFELLNREMSGRGRGRLIIRALCNGIARNRYQNLNETIFFIPFEYQPGEAL